MRSFGSEPSIVARRVATLAESDEGHSCSISHTRDTVVCARAAGESKSSVYRKPADFGLSPLPRLIPLGQLKLHCFRPLCNVFGCMNSRSFAVDPPGVFIDILSFQFCRAMTSFQRSAAKLRRKL